MKPGRCAEPLNQLPGSVPLQVPAAATIVDRMSFLYYGVALSTYGPTPALEETVAIVNDELDQIEGELRTLQAEELPALEEKL